ncbi:ImmA/IrrE family metallo-endopeptidase, partial [Candidatus Woesearchaeota archaeon]|nr:ImmA/IrrE family metallo-endopeptidase [Candidatus Woesearchaeota archaeon]
IDDKTVETLLNVIKKNKIVFQRYFKLKARLLKEKKLSREDIYAPIKLKEKEYTYEYCKKTVLEAYKEFSEEAYKFAKEIFDLNHVHSEVMPGKLSGAFCYTVTKDISPYIMLNHTGKLRDLFTMMHEFGHGIHGRAAREQTYFTFHSSLPLAETASIFGETLLEKKMLKKISTSEKISLLSKSLDDKYASIQRQAFFVLFEIDAHELIKHGATVDELNKLYKKNLEEQFGSSIIVPDKFKHEWKYIPHIYHSPFYCYAYVFGNLLGLALYGIYEEQGDKFVKNYMNVLKAGGSDSAYNILMKNLNINIRQEEFWQKAFDLIKEEVEELEKLVK